MSTSFDHWCFDIPRKSHVQLCGFLRHSKSRGSNQSGLTDVLLQTENTISSNFYIDHRFLITQYCVTTPDALHVLYPGSLHWSTTSAVIKPSPQNLLN
ncbi:hypothetical protein IG631_09932 [Alternaria alternata]|nr:hypothetical protein IG631_09932 [Alternaria alternata]